ncbi:binding-protein-dependent transport systems inner membrane component [Thermobaculum terrenum ATCC BAA-798]|uniref:Binding-protein-dependent transport systems inner membrane component n=2 Tax=Thermobaculum TaxID=262406 RepID=D1CBN3_THET1|nr:binding-protein-dependent transport systems inner membrane component [Thermobaculum terrenum ATCC BAA-798]
MKYSMSGRSRRYGSALEPYLYLLPSLVIFTLFVGIPTLGAVVLSLLSWDGYTAPRFVGLANYVQAFSDPIFWLSLWHNVVLIPYYVLLPAVLGLAPAAVVHHLKLRGSSIFRVGFFLPYIMPGVLIGVVWRWMLNPAFGPVNSLLGLVGIQPLGWLGDFNLALPSVGLIGAWATYGFCYVVFLAGLQKIPQELYEAARIDGASGWQEFLAVTLPGLRGEIAVVIAVNLINALKVFDVIWATTRGGPGRSTSVVVLYMLENAFNINRVGYGSVLGVIIAVLTLGLTLVTLRLFGESSD